MADEIVFSDEQTNFINSYIDNVVFNNTLNTFFNSVFDVIKFSRPILYDRCLQIGNVSLNLASSLNKTVTPEISLAFYMANIGFIGVPDSIYFKKGDLSEKEIEFLRKHADLSANLIKPVSELAANIILLHHEIPSGGGYKGNRSPKEAGDPDDYCYLIGIAERFTGAISLYRSIYKAQNDFDKAYKIAMEPFEKMYKIIDENSQEIIKEVLFNEYIKNNIDTLPEFYPEIDNTDENNIEHTDNNDTDENNIEDGKNDDIREQNIDESEYNKDTDSSKFNDDDIIYGDNQTAPAEENKKEENLND